jgi:hypothetical protein
MSTNFITRFFRSLTGTKLIRRFELLLPLKYNSGTAIEPDKFNHTARELTDRFEGLSWDLIRVHGLWTSEGQTYADELMRLRVDTADPTAKAFFKGRKPVWKERFNQLDLWITVHEIEVI